MNHDFDVDNERLKADVATMRVNCVTRQDLKLELAALEERLLARMDKMGGDVARISERLEETIAGLAALKVFLAAELPHHASKADLHELASSTRSWMVTAMISMFLGFAGLGFMVVHALKPIAVG